MIRIIIILVILFLLIFFIIQLLTFTPKREIGEYIILSEVIPGARIISETEGIIEYNGQRFLLGLNDLNRKRELIRILRLDTISAYTVIDMRFRRQIILRKDVF